MALSLGRAAETLRVLFLEIQPLLLTGTAPAVSSELTPAFDTIFESSVQAYREGLLGCALSRLQDRTINIRLPYISQGLNAFNGRTLDEEVINPFFQEYRILSSRGPYLAMFRRDFRFDESKRAGLRDKTGYDAFLVLITALESMSEEPDIRSFTAYLLYRFAKLRESSEIQLSRLQRISQEQYEKLIGSLLNTPSGGRLPVVIVVAALRSIKEFFGLSWVINHQGINVADSQSGVGGDITVFQDSRIVFAAEVTDKAPGTFASNGDFQYENRAA